MVLPWFDPEPTERMGLLAPFLGLAKEVTRLYLCSVAIDAIAKNVSLMVRCEERRLASRRDEALHPAD